MKTICCRPSVTSAEFLRFDSFLSLDVLPPVAMFFTGSLDMSARRIGARCLMQAAARVHCPNFHLETKMEVIKSELLFPKLNGAEIAMLSTFGSERSTASGEILCDPGDTDVPVFVVLDGCLDIVRVFKKGEPMVVSHAPGEFSGEVNLLLGEPSSIRAKTKNRIVCLKSHGKIYCTLGKPTLCLARYS